MTESFKLLLMTGLVYLLLSGVYMLWNWSKISKEGFIAGYSIFAALLLVEIDFGPASPRVWVIFLLFAWAMLRVSNKQFDPMIIQVLRPILILWACFTAWTFFCDLGHGKLNLDFQMFGYVNTKLSKFAVPIMACISFAVLLRREVDIRFMVYVGLCTVSISVAVGYLQFFDIPYGWEIHRKFRPITVAVEELLKNRKVESQNITGLSGRSIQFAYTLITFGIFSFSYVMIKQKGSKFAYWASLAIFGGFALAAYMAKSRSGMIAFMLSGLASWVILFKLYHGFRPQKAVFGVFMLGAALLAVVLVIKGQEAFKYENFDRMTSLQDDYRIWQAQMAIKETAANPIIGVGSGNYSRMYEKTPHNLFLNAGVYYGVPGVLFACWHIGMLWTLYLWYKRVVAHITELSWVTFGCALAVMNYTWNSMTHNDSFITGGFFLYYILGLFAASIAWELRHTRRGGQMPRRIR